MRKFFRVWLPLLSISLLWGCASMSSLMQAIDKNDPKAIEDLLQSGADINATSQCDNAMQEFESYTPLGCAAKNGRTAAVKVLLDKGADINQKKGGYRFGNYNPTPLILAAREGHAETVKLLLARGADIKATDSMLQLSALMWTVLSAQREHAEIVKLLLDRGANANETTGSGKTPLIFAAENGSADDAKILLARGARINAKTEKGATALSSAAFNGHHDVVQILVAAGADLDAAAVVLESGVHSSKEAAEVTKYKQGLNLLGKYAKKPEPASPSTSAGAISREELTSIVKEAVAESAKTQKRTPRLSTGSSSDIENPSFHTSERIMSDNDLAVIIGIEGYQNIPKADYAYDDAVLVKAYAKALGFKERNIELLTDERATLSGIVKSIDIWLKNKAKPSSRILVYYSGHGAPDPATGEAYLVPYDGDPNYLAVTGYPLKRLYETLGKLPAAEVTVVLDACFSGAGGRSVLAKGARPLVITAGIITVGKNMAVLSATQGSQISTSSPEKGHGVFTYYFLKAIKDGRKSVAEIYDQIKPQVEDEAKQLNVQQSPSVSPDIERLKGRFSLRK